MRQNLRYLTTLVLSFLTCCFANLSAQNTTPPTTGDDICQLGSLDLSTVTFFNDNGKTAVRANQNTLGGSLVIKGTTYESGVGTHADSKFVVKVNGATKFHAILGIDDGAVQQANHGIVDYTLTTYDADKQATVKASGTITRSGDKADTVDVDLSAAFTSSSILIKAHKLGLTMWTWAMPISPLPTRSLNLSLRARCG